MPWKRIVTADDADGRPAEWHDVEVPEPDGDEAYDAQRDLAGLEEGTLFTHGFAESYRNAWEMHRKLHER